MINTFKNFKGTKAEKIIAIILCIILSPIVFGVREVIYIKRSIVKFFIDLNKEFKKEFKLTLLETTIVVGIYAIIVSIIALLTFAIFIMCWAALPSSYFTH